MREGEERVEDNFPFAGLSGEERRQIVLRLHLDVWECLLVLLEKKITVFHHPSTIVFVQDTSDFLQKGPSKNTLTTAIRNLIGL